MAALPAPRARHLNPTPGLLAAEQDVTSHHGAPFRLKVAVLAALMLLLLSPSSSGPSSAPAAAAEAVQADVFQSAMLAASKVLANQKIDGSAQGVGGRMTSELSWRGRGGSRRWVEGGRVGGGGRRLLQNTQQALAQQDNFYLQLLNKYGLNLLLEPCPLPSACRPLIDITCCNKQGLIFSLNLANQKLKGPFPSTIANLGQLQYLNLSSNQLQGNLPVALGNLTSLTSLDLSANKLSGVVPTSLAFLANLQTLTWAENVDLLCPSSDISRFKYCPQYTETELNSAFCNTTVPNPNSNCFIYCLTCVKSVEVSLKPPAPRLSPTSPESPAPFPPPPAPPPPAASGGSSGLSSTVIAIIIVVPIIVIAVVLAVVVCCCCNVPWVPSFLRGKIVVSGCRRFSLAELKAATDDFSEAAVLGQGGYGVVYRGVGKKGEVWAVKRAKVTVDEKDFQREVRLVSSLRHKSIIRLLGFCDQKNSLGQREQLLVYEFAPNGTLRDHLHGGAEPLTLSQRLEIATDMAEALRYLHQFEAPLVHRDVKPENILLDANMKAKLSDFGVIKELAVGTGVEADETRLLGTPGYVDPEYVRSRRATPKVDVYSFGVVLLEMVTGRDPNDLEQTADLEARGLRKWVKTHMRTEGVESVIDLALKDEYASFPSGVEQLLQIGISCTEMPVTSRIDMKEVLDRLKKLKAMCFPNEDTGPVRTSSL